MLNCPVHSRVAAESEGQEPRQVAWKFPSRNPIKNLWSNFKHMQCTLSMAGLKRNSQKVWSEVTDNNFQCIYVSTLSCMEAVIAQEGGHMEVLKLLDPCICYFLVNKRASTVSVEIVLT